MLYIYMHHRSFYFLHHKRLCEECPGRTIFAVVPVSVSPLQVQEVSKLEEAWQTAEC